MMPPPVHACSRTNPMIPVCGYSGPRTVAAAGSRPITCEVCLDLIVEQTLDTNPVPDPGWFGT